MKNKYIKIITSLALLVVMTDAAMISIKVHGFYTHFIKYEQTNTATTVKLEANVKRTGIKEKAHKEI